MQPSRRPVVVAFLSLLLACDTGEILDGTVPETGSDSALGDDRADPQPDSIVEEHDPDLGDVTRVSFSDSGALVANPERGYYVGVDLLNVNSAAQVRASGHTLAIALIRL